MDKEHLVTIEVEVNSELLHQVEEIIRPMGITIEQLIQRFLEWLVHPDSKEEAAALMSKWKEELV